MGRSNVTQKSQLIKLMTSGFNSDRFPFARCEPGHFPTVIRWVSTNESWISGTNCRLFPWRKQVSFKLKGCCQCWFPYTAACSPKKNDFARHLCRMEPWRVVIVNCEMNSQPILVQDQKCIRREIWYTISWYGIGMTWWLLWNEFELLFTLQQIVENF